MSYISEIFCRLDMQHIREFLLHGAECMEIDRRPYKMRIEEAREGVLKILEEALPEMEERQRITEKIYEYNGMCEEVYMEIGLQSGMILALQVFQNISAQSIGEERKT